MAIVKLNSQYFDSSSIFLRMSFGKRIILSKLIRRTLEGNLRYGDLNKKA